MRLCIHLGVPDKNKNGKIDVRLGFNKCTVNIKKKETECMFF